MSKQANEASRPNDRTNEQSRGPLSDDQLTGVVGGFNPQPDPPKIKGGTFSLPGFAVRGR